MFADDPMDVVGPQAQSRRLNTVGIHSRGDICEQPHNHDCYIAFILQLQYIALTV